MMRRAKEKKCKICSNIFNALLSTQKVCSPKCALDLAVKERLKREEKEKKEEDRYWREKKKQLNETIKFWKPKAQSAFNEYIRLRDHDKPCVSCGRYESQLTGSSIRGGKWDCGHYRSVGSAPELRFEPLNAHKQCKQCNSHKSGNHVEYRFGISARLTKEELDWLEGPHEPKRYRVEDYKKIYAEYKAKSKEIKALPKL